MPGLVEGAGGWCRRVVCYAADLHRRKRSFGEELRRALQCSCRVGLRWVVGAPEGIDVVEAVDRARHSAEETSVEEAEEEGRTVHTLVVRSLVSFGEEVRTWERLGAVVDMLSLSAMPIWRERRRHTVSITCWRGCCLC